MPSRSSAARMACAVATLPGLSPWMQSVPGCSSTTVPSSASTVPSSAIRTARAAASSASWMIAPGVPRLASEPSGA